MSPSRESVKVGQVWIDPDTGLGWEVVGVCENHGATLMATVEQERDVDDVLRNFHLDPPGEM